MGLDGAGIWFAGMLGDGGADEGLAERIIGHDVDRIAAQWLTMQHYLMDLGDEALQLIGWRG